MPTHIRKAGVIGIMIALTLVFIPAISVNRVGAQSCEISDWWEREAQPILVEYFDVAEIAALLGRLNLGPVLVDLRAAERRFEYLESPDCVAEAKSNFRIGMQHVFQAFAEFIVDENSTAQENFDIAEDYFLEAFLSLQSLDDLHFNMRFASHFLTDDNSVLSTRGMSSVTFSRPMPTSSSTPRPTTTPRPAITPQATLSADQTQLGASNLSCENALPVEIVRAISAGNIAEEGIEVRNNGATIDLEDFVLVINSDLTYFTFSSGFRVFTGGSFTVFSRVGDNNPIALFADLDQAQLFSGDEVLLLDDDGCVVSRLEIP